MEDPEKAVSGTAVTTEDAGNPADGVADPQRTDEHVLIDIGDSDSGTAGTSTGQASETIQIPRPPLQTGWFARFWLHVVRTKSTWLVIFGLVLISSLFHQSDGKAYNILYMVVMLFTMCLHYVECLLAPAIRPVVEQMLFGRGLDN